MELLVVISILGVLAAIGLVSFASSQARGRDAERKSDLKQIATSLELYYTDYGSYPASINGEVEGCPSTAPAVCVWGADGSSAEFTDGKTVYFKALPKDPSAGKNYYYRAVPTDSLAPQGFQLYAHLENSQDPECIGKNCGIHNDLPSDLTCGGTTTCNFAITSPNVTALTQ